MQAGGNDAVRAVVSKAEPRLQQHAREFEHWVYKPVRGHEQVVVVRVPHSRQMVQLACACSGGMPHCTCDSSRALTQASRSQHYKYGLDRAFRKRRHSHVILLEDDMQATPDFLLYFEVRWPCKIHLPCCNYVDRSISGTLQCCMQAMAPLLDVDPALWCISAWNDNSRAAGFRWDAKRMVTLAWLCLIG